MAESQDHKVTLKKIWSQCLGHLIKEIAVGFTQVEKNEGTTLYLL